jgi:attachment invasion locus protein
MKKVILASALAFAAIAAQAQTYGEIGYTAITLKGSTDSDESAKSSPSAIRGILGYELNPNLAVEGMLAFGMSSAALKVDGVTTSGLDLKINDAIGLYLKPKTKLTKDIEVFGRVGYARVKGTLSIPDGTSDSFSESSFSYGAGLSYAISPATSLNADYMQYLSKDGTTVNGFTFGLGFKF